MRAVLTNFGSTGSVYPYIALGIEMQRHGHHPVLALPPSFAETAARHGLAFVPVGPDQRGIQTRINETMTSMPQRADEIVTLLAPLAEALPRMYDDLAAACTGADLLISGPVQPAALMVHETTGIPYVSVQNVHYASGGDGPFRAALATVVNGTRVRHGLRPLHDPIMQTNDAAMLVLFAMSRHVRPRHSSWPAHFHVTGYFFVDEAWAPDDALAAFMAAGPPPLAVTFGSMTHANAPAITDLVVEAVNLAGCRAVIQQGWSGLGGTALPDHIRRIGVVPHEWLFPRSSAVVHHGGSGTTAAVFRAGVPSVCVPHAWEQPIWAQLASDLGCAPPMIPLHELTATGLGRAIAKVLGHPGYRDAAGTLAGKIRAERGVGAARRLLERLASHLGLS